MDKINELETIVKYVEKDHNSTKMLLATKENPPFIPFILPLPSVKIEEGYKIVFDGPIDAYKKAAIYDKDKRILLLDSLLMKFYSEIKKIKPFKIVTKFENNWKKYNFKNKDEAKQYATFLLPYLQTMSNSCEYLLNKYPIEKFREQFN